ncbi:MAG: serine hydrolase domain-containing protein [Nevskiales bacterium]
MRQKPINKTHPSWLRAILILTIWLGVSGCITLSSQSLDIKDLEHNSQASDATLQEQVDSLAKPLIGDVTPGLMVAVYSPQTGNRFFGYGRYDQAIDKTPDEQTAFAIGSLTKLFTGALVSHYVQLGELDWSDTLGELLPAANGLSTDAKAISLEQLVTHTSGLPRQPMTVQTFSYFLRYLFTGQSFYDHFDFDYMMRFLQDFEKPTFPGYVYSNFGYALLGHILELHTGRSIEGLMDEHIWGPLALQETTLSKDTLPRHLATAKGYAGDQPGFIRRGKPTPDWQFNPVMRATGAMYSTAGDLLQFARAHFQPGNTPIGPALADSLIVRFEDGKLAIAVDWEAQQINSQRIHFAVGFVAGYSSYIGLDAANQLAVVVLQNSFNWDDEIGHRLLLRLGANTQARPAQPPLITAQQQERR